MNALDSHFIHETYSSQKKSWYIGKKLFDEYWYKHRKFGLLYYCKIWLIAVMKHKQKQEEKFFIKLIQLLIIKKLFKNPFKS